MLLDELYLAPAARGRGWGRQALAVARDWAAGQGAAVIRLEVNHHNAKAKRLYLSAGYRDDARDILTLSLNGQAGGLHS
ncbi:putative acetyltransferase [compost metagenome]